MANYNNYSISRGKGKLYLKSAEPKEGYEEVTYGENQKTYHKYVDRIDGVLKYFDTKEAQTKDGKKLQFLEVTFVNGDDYNKVSVPLKNSKGNFTDEVKTLVSALNSSDVGKNMTLTVKKSAWESNGKSGENLNVYLNYVDIKNEEGKGLSTGFIPFAEIPRAVKEEDEDLGTTYDWRPVNKFFAQKIKEIKAKFGETESAPQTPPPAPTKAKEEKVKTALPNQTPQQAFDTTKSFAPDVNDDLPF
jgi:hypothetical protein